MKYLLKERIGDKYEIQRKVETGYAAVRCQSGTGGWDDREK